ncbi:allophanate hydrolase [Quadrisphaera granulorum]|uniref:Allophanate hydrolase n=1 Tax=Quadrisphaera granulorum TaxID=317664 RepID=A0A315ZW83_9ACTN|nr:allophanate hydrolase [Quadrisphaera granulorum]PWJ49901.1 allophanate hydrolase [Quadrisphaera granulorum]SZE98109.1 allophanate hydrolase [Quadrisphaera granulorum]
MLTTAQLLADLRAGRTTPTALVEQALDRIADRGDDGTWITVQRRDVLLARTAALEADPTARHLPLYGIPFGVKDSLDVAGLPTTLACPEYSETRGVPTTSAEVVLRLEAAGAVCLGKTNLDQFATGLNGTRTPYTVPRSTFGGDLISGGSSSGSALAVAGGVVAFAVATDTAGSGRVPAALNAVLGYKPSRGLISTVGLVPACRSLDCVTLIANTVDDVRRVMDVVAVAPDRRDPWSRRRSTARPPRVRIGLPYPAGLPFGHAGAGDDGLRAAHTAATSALDAVGDVVAVDPGPFLRAGELLYAGPWVAERTLEFGDFLSEHRGGVLDVVAGIIASGARFSAVDAFSAQYRLAELKAEAARTWEQVDVVVLPTIPTTFTVEQVLADPVATNTTLGTYTQSGNLLDLCGAVVPAPPTADGRPVGLMVLGPALADEAVLHVAERLAEIFGPQLPAERTDVLVAGHHLAGGPRHHELTERGARLVTATRTAASYRLLRFDDDDAGRSVPALLRTTGTPSAASGGVEVEVWSLPNDQLAGFLAGVPEVLELGTVELADGRIVPGLVCARNADPASATDITAAGGWRAHLAQLALTA